MMLTSIPPRPLHVLRDAAAFIHDLATLGLAMLCPCGTCEDSPSAARRWLADETDKTRADLATEPLAGMVRLDVPA